MSDIFGFEGKENKIVQKTANFEAKAAAKAVKESFESWQELYYGHTVQKQMIIEQYHACCSYLKRSAFLRTQLRRFLYTPNSARLDLSGCGITSKDMTSLICALAGRGCNLKPEKAKNIQEVRCNLGDSPFCSMDVSNNGLRAEGTVALMNVLLNADFFRLMLPLPNPTGSNLTAALSELDLSSNSLGIAGSVPIEKMLASPCCALKKLILCSNLLADLGCANVCRALKVNTTLSLLNLSENGAANAAGAQLGAALERNSALEELNLAYNHLRDSGARRIGQGLARNTSVRRLELQWNGFGDEETLAEFAKAIPTCGVAELNLAYNRIRLKGATILASYLEGGSGITELVLDGNLIGQIGARMLFRAVQEASRRGQEFRTSVSEAGRGTGIAREKSNPARTAEAPGCASAAFVFGCGVRLVWGRERVGLPRTHCAFF